MPTFNNFKEFEVYINKKISNALQNEVASTTKRVMNETIENVTYKQYTPTYYFRREDQGGLSDIDNMITILINENTIAIKNITTGNATYQHEIDGYDPGYIDEIIVRGIGYRWIKSRIYRMQPFPRDFYADTVEELKNTNEHIYAMYKGLKRQGVDVRR